MLSTLLASAAGLGLVAHQSGFVSWDMEGVDLGFTQVAYAGTEFGHPRGAAGLDDTAEMLRREEISDTGTIPAVDPFSVLNRQAPLAPKSKVANPKAAWLAGDSDQVAQGVIEKREYVLDSCGDGKDCADPKVDDLDHEVDDEAKELVLASIKDDLPDDDGHGDGGEEGRDGDDDHDDVDHEGDDHENENENDEHESDGDDHDSDDHDGGDHIGRDTRD